MDAKQNYEQFIKLKTPLAREFVTNVPFNELTNAIKSKLQLENVEMRYRIKPSNNSLFDVCVDIESNNIIDDTNCTLLSYMFKEMQIESFGYGHVYARLADGTRMKIPTSEEYFEYINPEDKVVFEFRLAIIVTYTSHYSGSNGVHLCEAIYNENTGWDISWYKED